MSFVDTQQYVPRIVRNAYILAVGYVAGYVMGVARTTVDNTVILDQVEDFNNLGLECAFTLGSLTNVTIKIEFSDDNTNWYIPSKTTFTTGVGVPVPAWYSLTASGNYYLNFNADFLSGGSFKAKYIRISSSGVGTITSSSLAITAILGTA